MDHRDWHARQETTRVRTEHHDYDVAYVDEGSGEPATLFVHGIPTWGYLYREIYDVAGRAIVPDLAGYGYTEHVGSGGYERSIREQEDLLFGLLDELGLESVQVVAHDIGGGAALRLAVHTDRVERLVLTNSVCYDSWPTIWDAVEEHAYSFVAKEWTDESLDSQLGQFVRDRLYDEDRLTDEFVAGMKAPFLERARPANDLALNLMALDTNQTLELVARHDEISAPTYLVWGTEDPRQHTGLVERLTDDLPVEDVTLLERAHHWVMQDRPDAFREAIVNYLTRGDTGRGDASSGPK